MASNVIPFPLRRVTNTRTDLTVEQCHRLEAGAIAHHDWEQAAFFRRAAIIVARQIELAEAVNDNVIPLRRA